MLSFGQFEISYPVIRFSSFFDKVASDIGVGVTDRQIFPSVTQGSEGYKILAVIIAVICVISLILFVVLIVKAYKDARAERKTFGMKVKGELEYPGYNRGNPKPTINTDDKGKDAWGKIDDE